MIILDEVEIQNYSSRGQKKGLKDRKGMLKGVCFRRFKSSLGNYVFQEGVEDIVFVKAIRDVVMRGVLVLSRSLGQNATMVGDGILE